jgi:serine/threonine protein phosphatase PrpC
MSHISYFALSERGLRAINEDSYCAERIGDYYFFGVADGLGGHACGEVASGIAIDCLKNAMKSCGGDIKNVLRDAVFDADEQILTQSEQSPEKRGMATTFIAAIVDDNLNCAVVNVGDSRGHIITNNNIRTTKDHSVVNELIDSGQIALEDAWQHPLSNVMSQALGDPESVIKPDFYEVNLLDTFLLLSSDGLHDRMKKEQIREIVFANEENMEKSCRELVEEAMSAGSDDNITVVLVHGKE